MGRGIELTEEQWSELDRVRSSARSTDIFRDCLIILRNGSRGTIALIGEDLGCGTDTVSPVRRSNCGGGLAALVPIKPAGRESTATPESLRAIGQAVQTLSQAPGYGFSNWSVVRLAEYLAKETGIRFSDDQLRRLLHQEGFSVQRPKHTMKGKRDEKAFRKAQKELQVLKKKRCGKTLPRP